MPALLGLFALPCNASPGIASLFAQLSPSTLGAAPVFARDRGIVSLGSDGGDGGGSAGGAARRAGGLCMDGAVTFWEGMSGSRRMRRMGAAAFGVSVEDEDVGREGIAATRR